MSIETEDRMTHREEIRMKPNAMKIAGEFIGKCLVFVVVYVVLITGLILLLVTIESILIKGLLILVVGGFSIWCVMWLKKSLDKVIDRLVEYICRNDDQI